MKFNKLIVFILLQFFCSNLLAQSLEGKDHRHSDTEHGINPNIFERSTGTSGTGANIDVICHKIFWRLNPDTTVKYIKGSVQFNFKTTVNNVSTITFDLRSVLLLDSIRFRSNKFTLNAGYTRAGNIVTLNLGATLANNFIDSFIVFYQGVPPAVSGAAQGFQRYADANAGNVINTLSESYEDRDWWPCKADMQDKIDSMEITVSVPWGKVGNATFPLVKDTFWVAANGKMIDSAIVGNNRIFKFKTKYPIASYLVSVHVARFNRVYRTVNTGTTNVPVVYNLLAGNTTRNNNAITAMDNTNLVLQAFSARIGEYPFRLEKHGFADGLQGAGGMEHQTMSSIVSSSLSNVGLLVHELAHQWFGDNVSFAHWNDLWLAEGFAEYSNALYRELVPSLGGAGSAFGIRNTQKTNAIALSTTSAWIPNANAGTSALIWSSNYGSSVYQRGAMVISMLRTMCGDSIFYSAMKKYQTELAGKVATTDTLRNYFNRELGRDISVFFNDFVGGSDTITTRLNSVGSPIDSINWNNPTTFGQSGKRLVIRVTNQLKTASSNVTYFRGPIQLHVKGALLANDTTITIFDWGGGNLSYAGKGISAPVAGNRLTYDLSFVPTNVFFDDSSRTMRRGGTIPSLHTNVTKVSSLESNLWLGTTNTDWNTASNWQANLVPAAGADVTIATAVANQPILPTNVTVGPLTILGANSVILNGSTMTLNMDVRATGTGTFTGSPTSNLIVETNAGEIRFVQTTAATRSLNTLTLKPNATATLGVGQLEIYGGLNLPDKANLNVKSNNLLIR